MLPGAHIWNQKKSKAGDENVCLNKIIHIRKIVGEKQYVCKEMKEGEGWGSRGIHFMPGRGADKESILYMRRK